MYNIAWTAGRYNADTLLEVRGSQLAVSLQNKTKYIDYQQQNVKTGYANNRNVMLSVPKNIEILAK